MAVVEGFNHWAEIAAKLQVGCSAIADETADAAVTNIQAQIVANGQVDTGDMLNGIAKEDGPDDMTKNITSAMYYWIYQNYGTRFIPARPFVEPGMEATGKVLDAKFAGIESRL